jgi:hypothetical protein
MRQARLLILVAALGLPEPASAQSMNAQEFFKRAQALKAKGAMALLSRDLKPMIREAKSAGMKARATRLAAVAAGRSPRYCPPKGSKRLGNEEFMRGMEAIPLAERMEIDLTEAITRMLVRKYPCNR